MVFLKGLFWGSLFFLSWKITFIFGLILGLFFRYWGVVVVFFIIDILSLSLNANSGFLFPKLPLTVISLVIIFLGGFVEKYIWIDKRNV